MDIMQELGNSLADTRLIYVENEAVPLLWPVLSGHLSFIEHDVPQLYTMASLLSSIEKEEMQLWAIGADMDYAASGITQILNYPVNRVLEVVACGGKDANSWLSLVEKLKIWGEMQGCSVLRVIGRKGWTRLLKDYNFNGERVVISAALHKDRS